MDHLVNMGPEAAGNLLVGRAEIEGKLGQHGQMDADFVRAEAMTGASAPQALVLCEGEVKAKWRPDHALATCEKAIHDAPYVSGPRLNTAMLLHRLGREAEAVKTLDGVEAKAGGASGLNDICYSLAVEGMMLDRALADCDASLKLRPDDAATLDSRAFVLMRMGRNADALAAYNAALAANPKEYNSLYGRALVEARLGRTADSARDTAAALAGRPAVRADFEEMGLS
jgi:tetratricopeptide (TPR) repeat protein